MATFLYRKIRCYSNTVSGYLMARWLSHRRLPHYHRLYFLSLGLMSNFRIPIWMFANLFIDLQLCLPFDYRLYYSEPLEKRVVADSFCWLAFDSVNFIICSPTNHYTNCETISLQIQAS